MIHTHLENIEPPFFKKKNPFTNLFPLIAASYNILKFYSGQGWVPVKCHSRVCVGVRNRDMGKCNIWFPHPSGRISPTELDSHCQSYNNNVAIEWDYYTCLNFFV
jgi:hypothetical protein